MPWSLIDFLLSVKFFLSVSFPELDVEGPSDFGRTGDFGVGLDFDRELDFFGVIFSEELSFFKSPFECNFVVSSFEEFLSGFSSFFFGFFFFTFGAFFF